MYDNTVVTEINEIFTVASPAGRTAIIKNRNSFGLSFCESGRITYMHKGKKYISDKNHAIILPMGQSYTLHGDKNGLFPVINFKCLKPICNTIITIPIENVASYMKDFETLKRLSLFNGNKAESMSVFYHILHRLSLQTSTHSELLPAVKYIESNYCDPSLSNAALAKQCNISEVYFRKLFKNRYGVGPKQFITDIRIANAKKLLSEGIYKINAVAAQCGFSNQYHFCRTFKEKTWLTPTEYRNQNINQKI